MSSYKTRKAQAKKAGAGANSESAQDKNCIRDDEYEEITGEPYTE